MSLCTTHNHRAFFLIYPFILSLNLNLISKLLAIISSLLLVIIINFIIVIIKIGLNARIQRVVFLSITIILFGLLFMLKDYVLAFKINYNKIQLYLIPSLSIVAFFLSVTLLKVLRNIRSNSAFSPEKVVFQFLRGKGFNFIKGYELAFSEVIVFLRTARSKNILFGGFIFQMSAYIYIHFLNNSTFLEFYFLLIAVTLIPYSYGQYLYSWNSDYISIILIKKINIFKYLNGKIFIISLLSITSSVIFLLLDVFNTCSFLLKVFCLVIYTCGLFPVLLIYLNLKSKKKINLNTQGFYSNWQGKGVNQLQSEVIFYGLALITYLIFFIIGKTNMELYVYSTLLLIGILSIIFYLVFFKVFERKFVSNRHHFFKYLHHGYIRD
jgi:hypothetical protein